MSLLRSTDWASLVVYTQAGGTFVQTPGDSSLVSVSYYKRLPRQRASSFSGVVTITLLDDRNLWTKYVKPGDWFVLYGFRNSTKRLITFGVVSSIDIDLSVENGAVARKAVITGYDFAYIIDQSMIWTTPVVPGLAKINLPALFSLGTPVAGTPTEIITEIYKAFFDTDLSTWILPEDLSGRSLPSVIDTTSYVSETRGSSVAQVIDPNNAYNLASLLSKWSNNTLNELFFDLMPVSKDGQLGPCLVLRERQFPVYGSSSAHIAWAMLPLSIVRYGEWIDATIARSDAERINIIQVGSSNNIAVAAESTLLYRPVLNRDSILRFGPRPLQPVTDYLLLASDQDPDEYKKWQWLLLSWYGINYELLSGVVDILGLRTDIRIGQRVRLESGGGTYIEAYVEGVRYLWDGLPGGWRTSIDITRGLQVHKSEGYYAKYMKLLEEAWYYWSTGDDSSAGQDSIDSVEPKLALHSYDPTLRDTRLHIEGMEDY